MALSATEPAVVAVVMAPSVVGGVPPSVPVAVAVFTPVRSLTYHFTPVEPRLELPNNQTLDPNSAVKLSLASTMNTSTFTCLVALSKVSIVSLIQTISAGDA